MGSAAAIRLLIRFRPDRVLCFWVFPCGLWARLAQPWVGVPHSGLEEADELVMAMVVRAASDHD